MTKPFSADASASNLGYLYQVRYALYALLDRVKRDPQVSVSIERLDDVAFDRDGTPEELIQLKHTLYAEQSDLGNASARLWKTLRNWSHKLLDDEALVASTVLTLVSTALANDNSAAGKLRPFDDRDETEALKMLRKTAETSKNEGNREAYQAFKALSFEQQKLLVKRIQVLDSHANIQAVRDLILGEFRVYTQHAESLYSRLEGWWFDQAINHLVTSDQIHAISGRALMHKIQELADQLKSDSLPNDFPESLEMDESELPANQRVFVEQLRLILLSDTRIRLAIGHFYRAFQQRHKWMTEGLVFPDELTSYEQYLVNEWRTQFLIMKENLVEPPDEADMQRLGKQLFDQFVETRGHRPLRDRYNDTGFSKGVLHLLANRLQVGWHAEFQERLTRLMLEGARQAA